MQLSEYFNFHLAVDVGLCLEGGDLVLDVDLSDEALGAVDEEVPLPVPEEHVLAEVPLQHRDLLLLVHL